MGGILNPLCGGDGAQLLPLVERHFSTDEQRSLFYRVLLAMPLKVLEQLLGRIGERVDKNRLDDFLHNLKLAAPENVRAP